MKSIGQTLNKYSIISMNLVFYFNKETPEEKKSPPNSNTKIDTKLCTHTHTHTQQSVVMLCGTSGTDYAEVSLRFIL